MRRIALLLATPAFLIAGCAGSSGTAESSAEISVPSTAAASAVDSDPSSSSEQAAVDAAFDHLILATHLLTQPKGDTLDELLTQYRAAATEMTSLRDELRGGLRGVPSATAENVAQAADKSAASLTALTACFEQSASGGDDCAALTKTASTDSNGLGVAAASLIQYGSRSDSEVLALLDEAQNPAGATPASTSAATFTFDCDEGSYTTYEAAWVQQEEYCEGVFVSGVPTTAQRELAAEWAERPIEKLTDTRLMKEMASLAGYCATSGPETYDYLEADEVDRSGQIEEFVTILKWCPDHPDATEINKRISAVQKSLEGGRKIFGSGLYRVGKEIAPGTYVSRGNSGGCYWERLNRNGDIIDNNFTNGSRVQVTISSGDFEFNSENCNTWKKP